MGAGSMSVGDNVCIKDSGCVYSKIHDAGDTVIIQDGLVFPSDTPDIGDKLIILQGDAEKLGSYCSTGSIYYLNIVYYKDSSWSYDSIEKYARCSGYWLTDEANCLPGNVCCFDGEIWAVYWYNDYIVLAHKSVSDIGDPLVAWTKENIISMTSARESFVAASSSNIYVTYVISDKIYCCKRDSDGTLTHETVFTSASNVVFLTDFDVSSGGYLGVVVSDPVDDNRISLQFKTAGWSDLDVATICPNVNKSGRVKFRTDGIPHVYWQSGYDGDPYHGYWSAGVIVSEIISAAYGELSAADITYDPSGGEIQIFSGSKSPGPVVDLHLYSYNVAGEYWQFYELQANIVSPMKGNLTFVENKDNYIYWLYDGSFYIYFDPTLSPDTEYHSFPQTIGSMIFHTVSVASRFYYGAAMDSSYVPYSMAQGYLPAQ